ELREEVKFILREKNSKIETIKQLEVLLDKRAGEMHTVKKDLNSLQISYKSLMNTLYSTEKERDHLAILLDTAQNFKNEYGSKGSSSESREDLDFSSSEFLDHHLNNSSDSNESSFVKSQVSVDLNINSKDNPKVIEIIKEHFLDIMKE